MVVGFVPGVVLALFFARVDASRFRFFLALLLFLVDMGEKGGGKGGIVFIWKRARFFQI